jgi:hypothetical protein
MCHAVGATLRRTPRRHLRTSTKASLLKREIRIVTLCAGRDGRAAALRHGKIDGFQLLDRRVIVDWDADGRGDLPVCDGNHDDVRERRVVLSAL